MTFTVMAPRLLASKAFLSAHISYSTHPMAHTSVLPSYGFPCTHNKCTCQGNACTIGATYQLHACRHIALTAQLHMYRQRLYMQSLWPQFLAVQPSFSLFLSLFSICAKCAVANCVASSYPAVLCLPAIDNPSYSAHVSRYAMRDSTMHNLSCKKQ